MSERLSLVTVLATSARIWWRNLPRLLAIVTLLFLPLVAWNAMHVSEELEHVVRRYYGFTSELGALATLPSGLFVLYTIATAAVTHGVAVALNGPPVPIGRSMRIAARRFFPVLGVAVLVRLATWTVVAALVWLVAVSLGSGEPQELIVAMGKAVMRYLFYFAIPVATVERPGTYRAIARGFHLARGSQLRVFAIVLVTQIITGLAFQLVLTVLPIDFDASTEDFHAALRVFILVNLGVSLLVFSFTSVVNAVTYWRLRELKEGPSADKLATIFD